MIIAASPRGCAIVPASAAMALRASLPSTHQFISPLAVPAESDVIDCVGIAVAETPWPGGVMKRLARPVVVLIGDDPLETESSGGPDAWRCVNGLARWARAVIVHGAGGEAQHYAEAVRACRKVGRVALIETSSKNAKAWAERMDCPRTLLILPRVGLHPVNNGGAA